MTWKMMENADSSKKNNKTILETVDDAGRFMHTVCNLLLQCSKQ